jgi:hypothetical protein
MFNFTSELFGKKSSNKRKRILLVGRIPLADPHPSREAGPAHARSQPITLAAPRPPPCGPHLLGPPSPKSSLVLCPRGIAHQIPADASPIHRPHTCYHCCRTTSPECTLPRPPSPVALPLSAKGALRASLHLLAPQRSKAATRLSPSSASTRVAVVR